MTFMQIQPESKHLSFSLAIFSSHWWTIGVSKALLFLQRRLKAFPPPPTHIQSLNSSLTHCHWMCSRYSGVFQSIFASNECSLDSDDVMLSWDMNSASYSSCSEPFTKSFAYLWQNSIEGAIRLMLPFPVSLMVSHATFYFSREVMSRYFCRHCNIFWVLFRMSPI